MILLLAGTVCHAQAADEWLQQKATERKYQIEQMATLRAYLRYVQKGYAVAAHGLTAISKSKAEGYALHKGFFDHLKGATPAISNYSKVAGIVALQLRIIQVSKEVQRKTTEEIFSDAQELDYFRRVFGEVLADCSAIITKLTAVVSLHGPEMKDDERLKRIDALYNDMQEAYVFAQDFESAIQVLRQQRKKEKAGVAASRTLHDVKKE